MDTVELDTATAIERLREIDAALDKATERLERLDAARADLDIRLQSAGADALLTGAELELPDKLRTDLERHTAERSALEAAVAGLRRRRPDAETAAAREIIAESTEALRALAVEIGAALADAEEHRRAMADAATRARETLHRHRRLVADGFAPAHRLLHPEDGPVVSDNLPDVAARPPIDTRQTALFCLDTRPETLPEMLRVREDAKPHKGEHHHG